MVQERSSITAPFVADDAEVVQRARVDHAAFAALYDEHVVAVFHYCLSLLRDRELAEDATSISFTKAYRHLDRFHRGSFRVWLLAIARNTAIDLSRARRSDTALDAHVELIDPRPTPEDLALANETARLVQSMLAALSTEQRRVVELRLSGMRACEISEQLGKSIEAVNALQYRAMERLRSTYALSEIVKEPRP